MLRNVSLDIESLARTNGLWIFGEWLRTPFLTPSVKTLLREIYVERFDLQTKAMLFALR